MFRCEYDSDCALERTVDFAFCNVHIKTPRGRQHALDVIQNNDLMLPSQIETAINAASELPESDYQTTSLEKMAEALDTIVSWKDEARRNLDRLGGPDNWRFQDRSGQEQQHTFLGIWERALDRLSKHLGTMGKQALNDKMVTLGKAQVDMMIRLMMGVITELKLSNEATDKARLILLEKLANEANLVPRVEQHAEKQLSISMRGEVVT